MKTVGGGRGLVYKMHRSIQRVSWNQPLITLNYREKLKTKTFENCPGPMILIYRLQCGGNWWGWFCFFLKKKRKTMNGIYLCAVCSPDSLDETTLTDSLWWFAFFFFFGCSLWLKASQPASRTDGRMFPCPNHLSQFIWEKHTQQTRSLTDGLTDWIVLPRDFSAIISQEKLIDELYRYFLNVVYCRSLIC